MTDIDRQIFGLLTAQNENMRSLFSTLARLGAQWRHAENDRCHDWITMLEPHPFYKAGQVLFDLLEWEDFILDGDDAPEVNLNFLSSLNGLLKKIEGIPEIPNVEFSMTLPKLEPGFYLYRDVILGALWLIVTGADSMPVILQSS